MVSMGIHRSLCSGNWESSGVSRSGVAEPCGSSDVCGAAPVSTPAVPGSPPCGDECLLRASEKLRLFPARITSSAFMSQ